MDFDPDDDTDDSSPASFISCGRATAAAGTRHLAPMDSWRLTSDMIATGWACWPAASVSPAAPWEHWSRADIDTDAIMSSPSSAGLSLLPKTTSPPPASPVTPPAFPEACTCSVMLSTVHFLFCESSSSSPARIFVTLKLAAAAVLCAGASSAPPCSRFTCLLSVERWAYVRPQPGSSQRKRFLPPCEAHNRVRNETGQDSRMFA